MSPTCRDIVEMLTDYLEERLSIAERTSLEAHLSACPACVEYLRQLRATADSLGELSVEELPPALESELVHIFRAWKRGR